MTELHSLSVLTIERARQEAERRHIAEYSESRDPDRRLRTAIYEILAVTAASVLDREPQEFEQAQQRPGWMGAWPPRAISKVQERMENDPLFHRLVQMQTKLIEEEIEACRAATQAPLGTYVRVNRINSLSITAFLALGISGELAAAALRITQQAVGQEREACARVAEGAIFGHDGTPEGIEIARLIREKK